MDYRVLSDTCRFHLGRICLVEINTYTTTKTHAVHGVLYLPGESYVEVREVLHEPDTSK
jgi:hypothetical protein